MLSRFVQRPAGLSTKLGLETAVRVRRGAYVNCRSIEQIEVGGEKSIQGSRSGFECALTSLKCCGNIRYMTHWRGRLAPPEDLLDSFWKWLFRKPFFDQEFDDECSPFFDVDQTRKLKRAIIILSAAMAAAIVAQLCFSVGVGRGRL